MISQPGTKVTRFATHLKGARPATAKSLLGDGGERVILLGENHIDSAHYFALMDMADDLRAEGVTHLAIESNQSAIANAMNAGQTPLLKCVHTMALLVAARQSGIKMATCDPARDIYEQLHAHDEESLDPWSRTSREDRFRERHMALALSKVLRRNRNAKVVMIVGQAHLPSEGGELVNELARLGHGARSIILQTPFENVLKVNVGRNNLLEDGFELAGLHQTSAIVPGGLVPFNLVKDSAIWRFPRKEISSDLWSPNQNYDLLFSDEPSADFDELCRSVLARSASVNDMEFAALLHQSKEQPSEAQRYLRVGAEMGSDWLRLQHAMLSSYLAGATRCAGDPAHKDLSAQASAGFAESTAFPGAQKAARAYIDMMSQAEIRWANELSPIADDGRSL